MFINKLPFLIMVSRGLCFGTVEFLTNHQIPTVTTAFRQMVQTYCQWGFCVTTTLANPEFELLQAVFGDISFNLCSQDEHVPEIEQYIWTVKDHTRSGYNSLPFERLPHVMLICLIGKAVFWLNAVPPSDVTSETLSP